MNRIFKLLFVLLLLVSFLLLPRFDFSKEYLKCKYLKYNGNKIYYEVHGNPNSKKTLVFVHGWCSSIQLWKYQLDSFKNYKVIAVDLPGNGQSSKNKRKSYNMEMFADSVTAVLRKEKAKNIVLLGHSMGFAVTEIMTIKNPGLYKGICSIDGSHFELPENEEEKEAWIQYNRDLAQSMTQESGREAFINKLFLPNTPQILKEDIFKISKSVPLSIAKSMIEGVEKDQDYWKIISIDIPCLAIYTPSYQLPENYKYQFNISFPDLEYHTLEGVSHFFMLEIPYKTNQLINNFLLKVYK